MKALITGITGMVGSHLAEYLLQNTDWEIHGLIRWRSPLDNIENIIKNINAKDRVYLHYGDLRDPQSINKVVSEVIPDYTFHLAAQSYPKTSFDSPLDTYETNISGHIEIWLALLLNIIEWINVISNIKYPTLNEKQICLLFNKIVLRFVVSIYLFKK